jgi:signal transduction histidine kinase
VLTIAAACEKIAEAVNYKSSEEAFIAGLLHDMGTLFFLHHYPKEYRQIVSGKVKAAPSILEAERKIFGTDHCEVGHLLASRWQLPSYIVAAIRDHHDDAVADSKSPITGIVRLATLMVDQSATGHAMELETRLPAITQAAQLLGLSKEKVDAVSISLMPAAIAVAKYLEVDIGDTEEILTRANKEIWRTYLMVENLFRERQELSQKLLQQERARGAYESKAIALATLSHYLNNAAMAIFGRSQMIRMADKSDDSGAFLKMLDVSLDVIDNGVKKMVAVLAEMKDISPIDEVEFLSTSKALNMDDRIQRRMLKMEKESGIVLPEEAEITS